MSRSESRARGRTALLQGALVAFLLGVPTMVVAQQVVPVRSGEAGVPDMKGGSGVVLPPGSVEVVSAGPASALVLPDGTEIPLEGAEGRVLDGTYGSLVRGPCELALRGSVSFAVPDGCTARVAVHECGEDSLTAPSGQLFIRNSAVLLRVEEGGRVCSDPGGRFVDLAGDGAATRDGRWVGFHGEGAMEDVQRAFERLGVFQTIRGPQGTVSSSRAFR